MAIFPTGPPAKPQTVCLIGSEMSDATGLFLRKKLGDRRFQTSCDRNNFVVHEVARLVFDPGNGAAVKQNAARSEPPAQILLSDGRADFQPGSQDILPDHI